MKIIILGAGAIGSLYGAKLSEHNDVTLVCREKHAGAINKSGLKVEGIINRTYDVRAVTKIKNIEKTTLLIVTTKAQDSKKAFLPVKNLIRKDTIILCLQNGLYSEDIIKKIVGKRCLVLRAITNFGAIFLEPGKVSYKTDSYTSIEKSKFSEKIAQNFTKCGLNAHVSKNIKHDMWKKLVLNCALNPVTAILKITNGGIIDQRLDPLKKLIIDECIRVAKKDGINFDFDFLEFLNKEFKNSKNRSSMQQDLLKGKKTEIDYLNGAVVNLGKKFGIKCPVNSAIVSIIKEMERLPKA
ncbi:MAG TPA: 2-dehydropantoate 2-reductase [Candidatus Nanoarchaeia archaeon]|nr:2-dehydropantoate 2-reductase [Candidatus Nanoarchaeia archaeon]